MNRALRAATMGVLLLGPLALSACSAGQVTQTATQDRDKAGPQTRRAIRASAALQAHAVERVHRRPVRRLEGEVHAASQLALRVPAIRGGDEQLVRPEKARPGPTDRDPEDLQDCCVEAL